MSYNNCLKTEYMPVGVVALDKDGRIIALNKRAESTLGNSYLGEDFFNITGVRMEEINEGINGGPYPIMNKNERSYKLVAYRDGEGEDADYTIMLTDVTSWEDLKDRYNNEKPCIALIEIDNYDQLIEDKASSPRLELSSEIDKIIRKWVMKTEAFVIRVAAGNYYIIFEQRYLEKMIELKFSILDEIRNLETESDFPASLSIGIGAGGKSITQTEDFARTALDLALGRGGDQAVIKRGKKIEYFGGTLQTVEKSNKGKSRIVGHALRQLIDQSRNVIIMGHRDADMDSFGAAIGITRLSQLIDKETYIVVDEVNKSLQTIYDYVKSINGYKIIDSKTAIELADEETLLVVVDTNIPSLTQCPELVDICDKKAVIDHHRKSADYIKDTVLSYIESYASSTSELVTEILQYMLSKRDLSKIEAEALLAGMIVDTNNFSIKTGVRTFDAAAWLRRQGADPTEVKRFFQVDYKDITDRAKAITSAEIREDGVAITVCGPISENAQILCAQVADQMLTIKGVKASFVLGTNAYGKTVISARSLGEKNVQLIMEHFGGGGHLTTAAAQVSTSVEETIEELKKVLEEK